MASGHLMEAPVAFGQRALPRLCREMRHSEPGTRVQALAALCDLVHDPERALESIRHGCVQQLKTLLQDNESAVRTKSTEVLYHLASHNVAREVMLHCGILSPLSELLDEPVASCRKNVHLTLNRLAHFPAAAEAMVREGLVPRLVKKVSEEDVDEEVCVLLLSSLRQCVRVEVLGALACGSVAVLRDRLAHCSPRIRTEAAGALLNISVVLEGKQSVCAEGVVPVLVSLLTDSDSSVQANAAGAIMNTAVISTGKSRCLSAGALGPLVQLVSSGERAVCVNALRALTTLAEAPGAKEVLLEHLPALRSRTGAGEEEVVRRAAQNALQVITWTP